MHIIDMCIRQQGIDAETTGMVASTRIAADVIRGECRVSSHPHKRMTTSWDT